MSNFSSPVASLKKTVMLLAILVVGSQLWAQTAASATATQDPFGQLHEALSSTADNLLTATAQRRAEPPAINRAPAQSPEATGVLNISVGGGRERAFQRVEQLRPVIEPILREEGVPTEMAAVVLVESGGQPTAVSSKGARGIWQFMPDTARRYGLTVSTDRDDRVDVKKSTRAAARYLRDLYQRFGDWPLALAAYNAGEEAVSGALGKASRSDFVGISDSLPRETRNYVPAVLAAMGHSFNAKPTQLLARSAARVLYATAALD